MKILVCLTLLFAGMQTYAQSPKISRITDTVFNTSFVSTDGEKFLRLEVVVDRSVDELWKLFTTQDGLKKWIAPVVDINLKVGGTVQTNYNNAAKIGDSGTITLYILSYIPSEMLVFKVNLNDQFAEKCRKEDKNLQEIIQLKAIGKKRTRVISTMEGWGRGKEWNDTYAFFEKGNTWTYKELLNALKK